MLRIGLGEDGDEGGGLLEGSLEGGKLLRDGGEGEISLIDSFVEKFK